VGHSEPPVKGSRLRSLEPLWDLFLQVPTQKQEVLSSTSEGRVAPSAVGQGSSLDRCTRSHMDSLSSCYFCGVALDEPLETYLLGTEDAGASVTLCPTCHRKLETVLDTVAVGDDALSKGDRSDPGLEADVPTTGQPTDPETAEDSEDGPIQAGADARDILVDPEPDQALDAEDETGTEAATADETASETGGDTIESGEAQDETAIEGRDAETESGDGDAETESGDGEAEMESGDGDAEVESRDSETASEGGESGADDAGDSQTDQTVRTSISALEYNKVMRLLQNREFPVEREEIEIIASNAYDLSRSDCTKVIDLAIDRGLIDEDGGQLERPEQ